MNKISCEPEIRKHIERIDQQLLPPWGEWDGDYICCPYCHQRQRQLYFTPRGIPILCPLCNERYRKP